MTLYVVGHGGRDAREGVTFVPAGMTVHFFSRFDEMLPQVNSEAVLAGHVRGSADAYSQPRAIPNYVLTPQEIELLVADLTVVVDETRLVAVPERLTLCTNRAGCAAAGVHTCAGLFGRMPFDSEVLLLVCRGPVRLPGMKGVLRGKAKVTKKLPGEQKPEHRDRMGRLAREVLALAKKNDDSASEYFDGLTTKDRAMLVSGFTGVRDWTHVRSAKEYLTERGALAYYRFYLSQDPKWQSTFDRDKALHGAAVEARDYAERFVNATQEQREAARTQMSDADLENLRYIDERVHALLGYRVDNSHLQPQDMVKLAWARARARNADVVSVLGTDWVRFHAAGDLLAVGDGHDTEVLQVLAQANDYFPFGLELSEGVMRCVKGQIEAAWREDGQSFGHDVVEQEIALLDGPTVAWVPWPDGLTR
ncbi:putative adhesin [Lentzea sp. NPDC051208]|uniref:putative adhesin n=1 Tax=Lentzea sp. NPDC051208 TaxID=3154642 RepID=UPI00342BAA51